MRRDNAHIFQVDASDFKDYDIYNFVYLFNPFPDIVMAKVMVAVIDSLVRRDRENVIIYNNPVCHADIVRSGVFSKIRDYPDKWGNGISIYTNYPGRSRITEQMI